jgi:hypothetical protein
MSTDSPKRSFGDRWRSFQIGARMRRALRPIPSMASLGLLALIIVLSFELLPAAVSDITLSVHARTEVLEIELDPAREFVWWLPAGTYSLVSGDQQGPQCRQRAQFDVVCDAGAKTALVIRNGATVRLETIPASEDAGGGGARFTLAIAPPGPAPSVNGAPAVITKASASEPSAFEIRTQGGGIVARSHDLVTFESSASEPWRIPLILQRVQIGGFLAESIAGPESLGGFRQPIMTEGDVRIFARTLGFKERYQVKEERFDPADVVQIPADREHSGLLLGLVSLDPGAAHFEVTLHTDLSGVVVRRLGAEHTIGVSMWLVMSKLPWWLALWVVLAAAITIASYHNNRRNAIKGMTDAD